MTWYRRLLCGEPIKRKEFILRILFFWSFTLGGFGLSGLLVDLPQSIYSLYYSLLLAAILALIICQLFWQYWRIRDVIHSRNYAALALLATLVLPLVALLWVVIPSKELESQGNGEE